MTLLFTFLNESGKKHTAKHYQHFSQRSSKEKPTAVTSDALLAHSQLTVANNLHE